ncbi:MAG: spermidine synthase [Candidatus Azotimanducaceae bacterium]|jgi:spermidine synthase
MRSDDIRSIAVLSAASVLIGSWELAITRVASVLFFYDLAYLVLALCLFGLGLGALFAKHLPDGFTVTRLLVTLIASMPVCYVALYETELAWLFGLFTLPFLLFGALSAMVWRRVAGANTRVWLYSTELLGAIAGLLFLGPALLSELPVNMLGDVGVATHLKETIVSEGLVNHEYSTTSVARTDLLETTRADVKYIFTDGMFVTRSVAWDGVSPEFDDRHVEDMARLKRLAFRAGEIDQVALLGAGAGFDIAVALQEGAGFVTAVEINPDTIRFAQRHDDWAGGVLNDSRVDVVQSEARRYMQKSQDRWDHINLTLLQTSPASLRGGQHLDARVLTLEAVALYLSRLKPGGIIAVIQNTAELAAATQGVLEAAVNFDQRKILRFRVVQENQTNNPFGYLFIVSNTAFSDSSAMTIIDQADELGIEKVVSFGDSNVLATDDRPFLFLSDVRISMQASLILALALLATGIGLSIQSSVSMARVTSLAAMFSGASAMAVQVMAIYWCQSAIGQPVLAMSVALASVLAGSGMGAALFGRRLTSRNGWQSGLLACGSILLMFAFMPWVANLGTAYSNTTAALMLSIPLMILALPLGLPFVAIMQYAQGIDHGEGVVLGFDGLGALVGTAVTTMVTLTLGFTSLGYGVAAGFFVFGLLARQLSTE